MSHHHLLNCDWSIECEDFTLRKMRKISVQQTEKTKVNQCEVSSDIAQHYQSSNNLQDQLESRKSKMKEDVFRTNPYLNAALFDYANHITKKKEVAQRKN